MVDSKSKDVEIEDPTTRETKKGEDLLVFVDGVTGQWTHTYGGGDISGKVLESGVLVVSKADDIAGLYNQGKWSSCRIPTQ